MKKLILLIAILMSSVVAYCDPYSITGTQNVTWIDEQSCTLTFTVSSDGSDEIEIDESEQSVVFKYGTKYYKGYYNSINVEGNVYVFGLDDINEMEG